MCVSVCVCVCVCVYAYVVLYTVIHELGNLYKYYEEDSLYLCVREHNKFIIKSAKHINKYTEIASL